MHIDELARATCIIYVDGRREGTGTLVTDNHVLTAAHVVRRSGVIAIRFHNELAGAAIDVERLPLSAEAEQLDIAMLKLGPSARRPAPAALWPPRRLPTKARTFGYPKAEGGAPRGVWRDSVVKGTVQGDRVQLDWDVAGTLDGHSGGPVCDSISSLMIGVLVEGSKAGHFDRMVPLSAIRRVWDGLPRPWHYPGKGTRIHFVQQAAGQRSIARGGDLFRGRQDALATVCRWLLAEMDPGMPLVITGQPGAGKSAVLARAAREIEKTRQCDGLAFHASSASIADLVDAVAAVCDVDTPPSWQELVAVLAGREEHPGVVVTVDALDEAASGQDRSDMGRVLRELARLDGLRVAVASRPLATGNRYRPGTHLYELGVLHGANSRNLVDLDADRFFAVEDLTAYAGTLLAQHGFAKPGPPGGSWEYYRQNEDVRARLARVIAERADRNYLVAGISAFQLSEDDKVLNPSSVRFNRSVVPSGIDEALSKYLDQLPAQRRRHEVGLLTALAYGRGPGLDDERWLAFTHVLGYSDVTVSDIAELKAGGAADYLLEIIDEPGGHVTRPFHHALADELISRRDQKADEIRLVKLLLAEGGAGGWIASSYYARTFAPSHAAEAGMLGNLIREADFLVAMAPSAMKPAARSFSSSDPTDPGSIYEVALPLLGDEMGVNAAVLEIVSFTQGNRDLAQELGELQIKRPYKIIGNIRPFDQVLSRFDGHTHYVFAAAQLDWPGLDHPVVVTASRDGTARVWDPLDPGRELARFDGHTRIVWAAAQLDWPGLDHPVVVTASGDGTARVWDPLDPGRELARFDGQKTGVLAVAVLPWPGLDHSVVATGGDRGTIRVWDPLDPGRELARCDPGGSEVWCVSTFDWPGLNHPALVAACGTTVRVWDPIDPGRELARYDGNMYGVRHVAALAWPGLDHPVVVIVGDDETAHVWDPLDPGRELARFEGHFGGVYGVTALAFPGLDHPVVVTIGDDETARLWDPLDPGQELARFNGHAGPVWGMSTLDWPGRDHPVLVTTSADMTARVWDPHDLSRDATASSAHIDEVFGIAALSWPGLDHQVVVTAAADRTARVWDPLDPGRELARFDGHTDKVGAVAVLPWPGLDHSVVVTGGHDETARVWDPLDPGRELARFDGHTSRVYAVAVLPWPGLDHPVLVTTSADMTARVWDPLDPGQELARFEGHMAPVTDAAVLSWPGLDHPVVVTTSVDTTAQVWDPTSYTAAANTRSRYERVMDPGIAPDFPAPALAKFNRHYANVMSVATIAWPGQDHPAVVTTSMDGTARAWDPCHPGRDLAVFSGHTNNVWGVGVIGWPDPDQQVVVTTSLDLTARIWNPYQTQRELACLPLLSQGHRIAVLDRTTLAIATARGFLVFDLNPLSTSLVMCRRSCSRPSTGTASHG